MHGLAQATWIENYLQKWPSMVHLLYLLTGAGYGLGSAGLRGLSGGILCIIACNTIWLIVKEKICSFSIKCHLYTLHFDTGFNQELRLLYLQV